MIIQENKELIRRQVEEVWNGHNLEKVDEFVGSDQLEEAIEHTKQFLTAFLDVRDSKQRFPVWGSLITNPGHSR